MCTTAEGGSEAGSGEPGGDLLGLAYMSGDESGDDAPFNPETEPYEPDPAAAAAAPASIKAEIVSELVAPAAAASLTIEQVKAEPKDESSAPMPPDRDDAGADRLI